LYVSDPTYLIKDEPSEVFIAKADGMTSMTVKYEIIKNTKTEIRDFIKYPIYNV